MKESQVKLILNQYEKSGKIMYEATLCGDYKANNREGKKLIKIFKKFEKDHDMAMQCIPELMKSDNVVIRSKAAAYCLSLKIYIKEAEAVLTEIGEDNENGIFGFNARMTLQVWRKQGYLKVYPEQWIN